MSTRPADRIIRGLAVVAAFFGAHAVVAGVVAPIVAMLFGQRTPSNHETWPVAIVIIYMAAFIGFSLAFGGFCLLIAWRIWRRPLTAKNVRWLSAMLCLALTGLMANGVMKLMSQLPAPDDAPSPYTNLATGVAGLVTICVHATLSRRLIDGSSLESQPPKPVNATVIVLACLLLWSSIFAVVNERIRQHYPLDGEHESLPTLVGLAGSTMLTYIIYRVVRYAVHDRRVRYDPLPTPDCSP